jgi:multidrug efflux pump subunit AcrB
MGLNYTFTLSADKNVSADTLREFLESVGNIGDIEITGGKRESLQILESWDAKYGKAYLRDEIEELNEKLQEHPEARIAGFVVDENPNLKPEIEERIKELEQIHNVRIEIVGFDSWVSQQATRIELPEKQIAGNWLLAFAESLCQMRRDRAPIDEPSDSWVKQLRLFAEKWH